jgi:hypothetical protein
VGKEKKRKRNQLWSMYCHCLENQECASLVGPFDLAGLTFLFIYFFNSSLL